MIVLCVRDFPIKPLKEYTEFVSGQGDLFEYLKINPVVVGNRYTEVENLSGEFSDEEIWIFIGIYDDGVFIGDSVYPRELFIDLAEYRDIQIDEILN